MFGDFEYKKNKQDQNVRFVGQLYQ